MRRRVISCKTRLGDDSAKLPALITVERINELRFPRMGSKISNIEIWDNSVLQADAERCGLCGSPTRVIKLLRHRAENADANLYHRLNFIRL